MRNDIDSLCDINVSVIIATMASSIRALSLVRAVESIRESSILPVQIIVVVNGKKNDHEVCQWLKAQPDIHFDYIEEPSLPKAIARGRSLVATQFFATLDDDDEYLPLAIDIRMEAMNGGALADLVVTNGYRMSENVGSVCYRDFSKVSDYPLQTLFEFPWLSSCNALYRTASIDLKYFENSHCYAEWTWLAFNLAMHKKEIKALDIPTFRINDTAVSLSKTQAYIDAQKSLFAKMLDLSPPNDVVKLVRKKLGALYHQFADSSLKNENRMEALQWHLRSLVQPDGYRYLSFTRHLLSRTK